MAYAITQTHTASTTALGGNLPYRGLEWHSTHNPRYHIYVFNASARTFKGVGRINLTVPGVEEDDPTAVMEEVPDPKDRKKKILTESKGKEHERDHYVTSFPQPILLPAFNDMSGEIEQKETDGIRFVVDMISPDNQTLSLDTVIRPDQVFSVGNDFAQKGIFFSLSNPPLKQDLRKAIDRMEAYYKNLLERAATLELTDKPKLSEELGSNPDYSYAANYFGKDVAWNRKQTRPVTCPNCGEQKPAKIKFHIASDGGLCVEPTIDAWKAVVSAGRRTYDQVPFEFRWQKEK